MCVMFRKALLLILCLPVLAYAESGNTLVTHVRGFIAQPDSTNSVVTNTQIRTYLKMSMKMLPSLGLMKQRDTTYAGGSMQFTPPSDFISFAGPGLLVRGTEVVMYIPTLSSDSLWRTNRKPTRENMGADNHWLVYMGDKLQLFPSTEDTFDSVRITYYSRPSTTIDTTEVPVVAEWEYVISVNAAAIAFASMQDWGGYDRMIVERDKLLTGLRGIEALRPYPLP